VQKHRWILVVFLLLTLVGGSVAAQTPGTAFAVVRDNELFITNLLDVYNKVNNPPHQGFNSLAWSPDGQTLAYILQDDNFEPRLMIAPAGGGDGVLLSGAGRIETGFPVSWTPDGQILYAESTFDPDNPPTSPEYFVKINTISPTVAGAAPTTLGTIPFGVGCGGGSPLPADWQYWNEVGGFGGGYLTLQYTDYGILHSINCGGAGVALLINGQSRYLTNVLAENGIVQPEPYVGRLALSPDGRYVAAVQTNYTESNAVEQLVIIDLELATVTPQTTAAPPEQLAWGLDTALYYSTRTPNEGVDLIAALSPEARAQVEQVTGGGTGFTVGTWTVAIHRYDPATGADEQIYSADAYQIGRIRTTNTDPGALYFSEIPNLNAWVDALASGTFDPASDPTGELQRAFVPVMLFRLDLATGETDLKGEDLRQFTPRPTP
jgi:hypothetical protein